MKNIKSKILLVSVAIMVAITTLVASYTPINWGYFIFSVSILAILIWLQKRDLKKTLTESGSSELSLSKFEELINVIIVELNRISIEEINDKYLSELLSIMDNKMPNINEFRISIINQFGVANYTQISIPFAKGERLINRGVSAAIDGYLEISQKTIKNSIEFLQLSIAEIKKIILESNV